MDSCHTARITRLCKESRSHLRLVCARLAVATAAAITALLPKRAPLGRSAFYANLITALMVARVATLQAYVADDTAVRSGPAAGYPALTQIRRGSVLKLTGCFANRTWCVVDTDNIRGWVRGIDLEYSTPGSRQPVPQAWIKIPDVRDLHDGRKATSVFQAQNPSSRDSQEPKAGEYQTITGFRKDG